MPILYKIRVLFLLLTFFIFDACQEKPSVKNSSLPEPGSNQEPIDKYSMLNDSGVYYWREKEYSKSLSFLSSALNVAQTNQNMKQVASSLNNIGMVYYSQGEYNKCLDYYNQSIVILKEVKDSMKIAQSLMNTGLVYKKQGIFDKATLYLIEAARYFENNGIERQLASCYNSLANIQSDLGYFNEALKYHNKSITIWKNIDYQKGIAGSLNNIGSIYKNMDSLDLAINFYRQSLSTKGLQNNEASKASTFSNMGEVYFLMGKYKLAESNFNESMALRKNVNDRNGILTVSNKMAKLYLETGELLKASLALNTGHKIASEINSRYEALDNFKLHSELFIKQNKLNAALQSFYSYDSLKTLLFDEEKIKVLAELRIQYEAEKNEQEILSLNEIQEIQSEKIKAQNNMLLAMGFGLFMFLLLTTIVYRGYKQKQKSNRQIQLLMQERQHRAKNNLQIISELLGLQSGFVTDETAKGAILSGESRTQAVALIDKMLYRNLENTEINIPEYIKELVDNLLLLFGKNNNKINFKFDTDNISLDSNKATPLGLIVNELVTNSMKHAFKNQADPEIYIGLQQNKKGTLTLKYKDNGIGMPENINSENTKSLGMKLIRSLSKQLKGSFNTENQNGFNFLLEFNP